MKIMTTPSLTRPTLGILGGKGMLGSDLMRFLGERYETHAIDKDNYEGYRGRQFNVLINANGNSRRFWANDHPAEDFELSTLSVARSLFDFRYEKYIYISSPDAYEDPTNPTTTIESSPGDLRALSPYGFHKRLSEELVRRYTDDFLILRPAALIGTRLAQGIPYDILQGNELYVTLGSRVQFITTNAVADIVMILLERGAEREIVNAGGIGAVTPSDIGAWAGKQARVRHDAKPQQYEMNTEKCRSIYHALKTSEEYVRIFIQAK